HSLIAKANSVLTYRTDVSVRPGQLVLITLRRRTIPGIVINCNVTAGTVNKIIPVKKVANLVVPAPYLQFMRLVGDYYCVGLAQVFTQLMSNLNSRYVTTEPTTTGSADQVRTELFITPALHTPSVLALRNRFRPAILPTAIAQRDLWLEALKGSGGSLYGQLSSFGLPFSHLDRIIIDQPFTLSYQSRRTPGFSAPVLGSLMARAYGCPLVIRSILPLKLLARRLPLPENTLTQAPTLNKITVRVRPTGRYLNDDLVADMMERQRTKQRLLVIDNRPNKIEETALALAKRLPQPVPVHTMAALYQTITTDQIFILNVDRLWSSNSPLSMLAAIEGIGVLASRAPVLAQSFDQNSLFNRLLTSQLTESALNQAQLPLFDRRIITLAPRKKPSEKSRQETLFQLTTAFGTVSPLETPTKTGFWLIAPKKLSAKQQQLLLTLTGNWRLMTDALSFPLAPETKND
ncbi:MAG: hypothetical protein Q7S64_00060, partial [bacterium]|nr:hypothetical protein [bacterium]